MNAMSETILVCTVGGSPEPIKKSIRDREPDLIWLIPSRDSESEIDEILSCVYPDGNVPENKKQTISDPNNLVDSFSTCLKVFEKIRSNDEKVDRIIADPTGGTKIMSAALILAASELGVEICYIAGERTKRGLGTVMNGTEYSVYSSHPYDLIAKTNKIRFCEYFNKYRFLSAIDISRDIASKGTGELQQLFKCLRQVCEAYIQWDLFNLKPCKHNLESAYRNLTRIMKDSVKISKALTSLKVQLEQNVDYIRALPQSDYSLGLVDDLVANARRRATEGKYDDAVARLYRALEMIAQVRFIENFKCNTSKFSLNKLPDDIRREFFHDMDLSEQVDIGCLKAFEILSKIGDEYGKRFHESKDRLRSILHLRNKSILAHGNRPMKENDFEKLYSVFKDSFGLEGVVKFPQIDYNDILQIGLTN